MLFPQLTTDSPPPLPPYMSISRHRIVYDGLQLQEYYQQYFNLFYQNTLPLNLSSNARYPVPISAAPRVTCEDDITAFQILIVTLLVIFLIFGVSFFTMFRYDIAETKQVEMYKKAYEAWKKRADELEVKLKVVRGEGDMEWNKAFMQGRKRGREEGLYAGRALGLVSGKEKIGSDENGCEDGFELL